MQFFRARYPFPLDDFQLRAIAAIREGKSVVLFIPSRGRHTIFDCDWSSDVCSSDLLYEATFELRWLETARHLAETMIREFWDEENGGFFFTGSSHEALIQRSKEFEDNATPSEIGRASCRERV